MIRCIDLIHALEAYRTGYGDRSKLEGLLAMARQNQQRPTVFAWQRQRLAALIKDVEAGWVVERTSSEFPGSTVERSSDTTQRPSV